NITEIPTEITTLASHLKVLDVSNQKLVTIPDSILTTNWKAVWGKTFFSARNVDLSMFLVLLFFEKAN
ncbi:hypothetical protein D4324_15460, partial [Listeria monocytogenes]|nr:hypothetical protein [Listeria monocytogenes]